MTQLECPACGAIGEHRWVTSEAEGDTFRCGSCGSEFRVPVEEKAK